MNKSTILCFAFLSGMLPMAAEMPEVRPLKCGPRLTAEEFLTRRLTPEARAKCPDVHAFAAMARAHVAALPLNDEWRDKRYSKKDRSRLAANAAKTMAGKLCSCRT